MKLGAIFNTIKQVANVAAPALAVIPGYGPIIGAFVNAVFTAETAMPQPKKGLEKAALAQFALEPSIPALLQQMQDITGNTMTDPVRFLAYRTKQMEAVVELFHAFGVFDESKLAVKPPTEIK